MEQTASLRDLDVLSDCLDLAVVGSGSSPGTKTYAVKSSLRAQEILYSDSVADESEKGIPAFMGHWELGREGIEGLDTYLGLRLDKRALRPRQMWVPSLPQVRVLEARGKL